MRPSKKPRKYRVLMRAARLLEAEGREYATAGKALDNFDSNSELREEWGRMAAEMIGMARALRQIAKVGYRPNPPKRKRSTAAKDGA